MAALGELTGRLWSFVRSDPASIRHLNASGHWSTWQATRPASARHELAQAPPPASDAERRSLRRRRSLAA